MLPASFPRSQAIRVLPPLVDAMPVPDRTPQEWFAEAARCYIEMHQGCPWCQGSYRVSKIRYAAQVSYRCQHCDFQSTHDPAVDRYFCIPGEDAATVERLAYQI